MCIYQINRILNSKKYFGVRIGVMNYTAPVLGVKPDPLSNSVILDNSFR